MDERDFQAMQAQAVKNHHFAPMPKPSWYDIYRYATDESEWYEKERVRLVADGAKVDAIKEAVRQINFFEDIRGIADLQMMNACLQIARANEIVNPFDDFYDQPENHEQKAS